MTAPIYLSIIMCVSAVIYAVFAIWADDEPDETVDFHPLPETTVRSGGKILVWAFRSLCVLNVFGIIVVWAQFT